MQITSGGTFEMTWWPQTLGIYRGRLDFHTPEAVKLTDTNLSTLGSMQPSGMGKSRGEIIHLAKNVLEPVSSTLYNMSF